MKRTQDERDWNRLFGLRVALAREMAGMSQEQLAQKVGISRVTVAMIETGKQGVTAFQLSKILAAMGQRVGRWL